MIASSCISLVTLNFICSSNNQCPNSKLTQQPPDYNLSSHIGQPTQENMLAMLKQARLSGLHGNHIFIRKFKNWPFSLEEKIDVLFHIPPTKYNNILYKCTMTLYETNIKL